MSVSLNGFSIKIIPDSYVKHITNAGNNYFSIPSMSEYKIKLTNNRTVRCDAEIYIDGEPIGIWRIQAYSSIIVERPANINRKFVFTAEKSFDPFVYDADKSPVTKKLIPEKTVYGLITVIFKPENRFGCPYETSPYITAPAFYNEYEYSWSDATQAPDTTYVGSFGSVIQPTNFILDKGAYKSGATILGGGTDQIFGVTAKLCNIDNSNVTNISLRLIPAVTRPFVSVRNAMIQRPIDQSLVYQVQNRLYNDDRILIQKPYTNE